MDPNPESEHDRKDNKAGERSAFDAVSFRNMIRARKKPDDGPERRSWHMADILYGMPFDTPTLHRTPEAGSIVLGGCTSIIR
ncbi:MAG: hypothetical protein SWH78_08415 [Thermodesulfobacteriota bacterium]|nr:hypothetical protein [Thermodesulfobacteriota bacterium]